MNVKRKQTFFSSWEVDSTNICCRRGPRQLCMPVVTFQMRTVKARVTLMTGSKVRPLLLPAPGNQPFLQHGSRVPDWPWSMGKGQQEHQLTDHQSRRLWRSFWAQSFSVKCKCWSLVDKFKAVHFVHSSQAIVHGDWILNLLGKYYNSGGPDVGSDYNQLF